jgi:phospholipid N-methyltransferase
MIILDKLSLQYSGFLAFARELLAHPKKMGAACPSSKRLARAMVAQLPVTSTGKIVELGAGTGVITEALLERGIGENRLVVIERSDLLYQHLKNYFPHLSIIHGDAMDLEKIMSPSKGKVSAVISSLPLRLLKTKQVMQIQQQIHTILEPGGLYIQYTYQLYNSKNAIEGFEVLQTKTIWINVPPARVDVYVKK